MTDSKILAEIQKSVNQLAYSEKISPERAFAAWYGHNFLGIQIEDAIDSASLDGGEDQSIDLLFTDDVNERIIVLQAHFPKNTNKATPKSKWDGVITAISCIETPKIFRDAGRVELAAAAEEARAKLRSYDLTVGVVSLGRKSDQIERSKLAVESGERYNDFKFLYDARPNIEEKYLALKSGDRGIPEDYLQLLDNNCLEDSGGYGQAWVASIDAQELSRLYQKYGDDLFARNIRLFLGARKGGINEKIIETAKKSPGRFWALNNGITIVADTVTPVGNGRLKLTRFSVVNGCQTTVCLCKAGAQAGAKVLARVVAANPTVVSEIVRYNNTQNSIKIWTVRAADTIQEKLRAAFAKYSITYAPKPEDTKMRKNIDTIYLDKLAQFVASRDQDTIIAAVKEKSELFDRYYQEVFPVDIRIEDVYLMWLMGNYSDIERLKRLQLLQEQKDDDKLQKNLLGVAGTYWTIYSSHKILHDLNSHPLKFNMENLLSNEVQNSLRKYIEVGLDTYLDIAIDTYDQDDYGSVRSALRSPRFLTKFSQKLANKTARLKTKKTLPRLDGAIKSVRKT
jgi:hypothetical protein